MININPSAEGVIDSVAYKVSSVCCVRVDRPRCTLIKINIYFKYCVTFNLYYSLDISLRLVVSDTSAAIEVFSDICICPNFTTSREVT